MKNVPLLLLVLLNIHVHSQSLLFPGEIALISLAADGDKSFEVLFLSEVEAGTVIHFTDDAWIGATQRFGGSEGVLTYTAPGDLSAGSVVLCPGTDGGNGFVKTSGSFNPAGSGDNIIAYQGTSDDPFFLFGVGWARGATVWEYSEVSASYRSDIPPGLTPDLFTITSLGTDDNYQYLSSAGLTGTRHQILERLTNTTNYQSNNADPFAFSTFNFTLLPDTVVWDGRTLRSAPTMGTLLKNSTPSTPSTPSTFSTFSTPYTDIVVSAPTILSQPTTVRSITLAAGGSLTIAPSGSLILLSRMYGAQDPALLLIQSDATGTGSILCADDSIEATVERYVSANQWHFIASPVAGGYSASELLSGQEGEQSLYEWNETGGAWVEASSGTLYPGKGYNLFSTSNLTLRFTGMLNSFRTRGHLRLTKGAGGGWILAGNPFACALNWGAAAENDAPGWFGQHSRLEHKSIYVTTGGSGNATTWDTYNGNSGVGVPDNGVGVIASGQGFWIRASGNDSLGLGHYAKSEAVGAFRAPHPLAPTASVAPFGLPHPLAPTSSLAQLGLPHPLAPSPSFAPLGGEGGERAQLIRLRVTGPDGFTDEVAVLIDHRASHGWDPFDSPKFGVDRRRTGMWMEVEGGRAVIGAFSMVDRVDKVDRVEFFNGGTFSESNVQYVQPSQRLKNYTPSTSSTPSTLNNTPSTPTIRLQTPRPGTYLIELLNPQDIFFLSSLILEEPTGRRYDLLRNPRWEGVAPEGSDGVSLLLWLGRDTLIEEVDGVDKVDGVEFFNGGGGSDAADWKVSLFDLMGNQVNRFDESLASGVYLLVYQDGYRKIIKKIFFQGTL